MSRFIPVETPGGVIWVEVQDSEAVDSLLLTGVQEKAIDTFEGAVEALKRNASVIRETIADLEPDKIEITCGIKISAEAGTPIFGLAKAGGEANYEIVVKWDFKDKRK